MIPVRKDIKTELVRLLSESGPKRVNEVYKALASRFSLAPSDLSKTINGSENYFEKEVRWAKKDLVDSGVIKKPADSGHGIWEIDDAVFPVQEDLSPVLCQTPEELEAALSKLKSTKAPPQGQEKPNRITSSNESFERDARVVKFILYQAAGTCEVCDQVSPFRKDNGEPFLEVHHIKSLADGGSDFITNAVAACPNCHRELHYGVNRDELRAFIYTKISRLVVE